MRTRRTFLKSLPMLAAGVAAIPTTAITAVEKAPCNSVALFYSYPGCPKSSGIKTWNTQTMAEYEKAKEQQLFWWAILASRGYKVDPCEFSVVRHV